MILPVGSDSVSYLPLYQRLHLTILHKYEGILAEVLIPPANHLVGTTNDCLGVFYF